MNEHDLDNGIINRNKFYLVIQESSMHEVKDKSELNYLYFDRNSDYQNMKQKEMEYDFKIFKEKVKAKLNIKK